MVTAIILKSNAVFSHSTVEKEIQRSTIGFSFPLEAIRESYPDYINCLFILIDLFIGPETLEN